MCKCCEEIEFLKNIYRIGIDTRNIKRELKARLTTISKRKGQRMHCGRIDYKEYDLNYCPMCGRKLGLGDD